jgi:hydrogenase large subunit
MPKKLKIDVPMNRVEGDLEIMAEVDDGIVRDAWAAGTMFRGFERILMGRGAMDGLVITPRICGICTTAHLLAAASALDDLTGVSAPPDAVRVRNILSTTEHLQSDLRQGFITFAADLTDATYQDKEHFGEVVKRFEPFKGETVVEVIRETRHLLEIIALLAGQWPHSNSMVPGGIVSRPSATDLSQCLFILSNFHRWYEQRILGCSLDRWLEIRTVEDLDAWLDESPAHRSSDMGLFITFAREIGLHETGNGHGNFVSFGSLDLPEGTQVKSFGKGNRFIPSGFVSNGKTKPFDPTQVVEHVAYSWYMDQEGGRRPAEGETRPYATGQEGKKYSWAKAPRYKGAAAETGPLAELVIARNPLVTDALKKYGVSTFTRQLARIIRPALWMPALSTWLLETDPKGIFYQNPGPIPDGDGVGLVEASRGALGHWMSVKDGVIQRYQIITPTAWNASPRDDGDCRGPMEEAMVGTPIEDPENPVELGHVVRSFDPCLVCTVHSIDRRGRRGRIKVRV